jgi:hypothetical protein
MKQETLEEVAKERLINSGLPIDGDFGEGYITGSIFGAKWQQEQDKNKYSEEDLEVAYFEGKEGLYSFKEWLQQFKNK